MSKHRSEPTTDTPTGAQDWRILLGGPFTAEGPSRLTYAETVRAAAGIDRYAGRAREIYAKIPLARPEHLWLYLMQAASLAASIQALPPESPASDPDTTYKTLDDAVLACREYLGTLAALHYELNTITGETALLGLIQRAKDLSHELENAAIAGLDLDDAAIAGLDLDDAETTKGAGA